MPEELVTTRQEHLCQLAGFCKALDETLRSTGLTPEQSLQVFQIAVTAECVGCGIAISGNELFALSQPPAAERASIKTGRLRLGDCARQGCEAWHYRLAFRPQPQLDWPKLLGQVESRQRQQPVAVHPAVPLWNWVSLLRSRKVVRLGTALAALLLLLLIRHWQQGGRIPLLHEPENFKVDILPHEESNH